VETCNCFGLILREFGGLQFYSWT